MRIVLYERDEVISDLSFESGPLSLGSDIASAVHLPDMGVALAHARLCQSPTGQWMLEAVAPGVRTAVNGRDLDKRCPLHNGDRIEIHGFSLRVVVDGELELGKTGKTSLDELARIREFPLPKYGEAKNCELPITLSPQQQSGLARFGQQIAGAADVDALVNLTLPYIISRLSARMSWFGIRFQPRGDLEFMEGRTADGGPGNDPVIQPTLEYRCLERGQAVRLRRIADGASAIAVPLRARRGHLGMLYAETILEADRFHASELETLVALSAHVAARLEDLLLGDAVQTAGPRPAAGSGDFLRDVQARLTPDRQPSWSGFGLAVHHRPGAECGGDVYDFLTMPNGMGSIVVANAIGEPLDTALALNEVRTACRIASLHGDPPRTLLRELHWLLLGHQGRRTLAAVNVVLNPKSGVFEYATAGDLGAVVVGNEGQPRVLTKPNIPRLGLTKSVELAVTSDRLKPGETLCLFTPGCGTICDGSGQALGGKRLLRALHKTAGMPPGDQLDELATELAAFFKDGTQRDDITIVALRRNP